MTDIEALRDACFKLFQEHCTQYRHYETQRATVAAIILAVASALVGLVTFDRAIGETDIPLTVLLIALGVFGAFFSVKQYERACMHRERYRHYRDAIENTFPDGLLKQLRLSAVQAHESSFVRVRRLKVHKFWILLHVLISLIGFSLFLIALFFPQTTV